MKSKAIELVGVSKEFISRSVCNLAVKGISFSVDAEDVVCIMGPSGCGKSTILNMLGGIEIPSSGEIIIDDTVYPDGVKGDALRKFGYVFQNDNLLQWRSVSHNLDFPLEIMNLKGEEWERRKDDLLDMVGLKAYKAAYPFELSGGMKQRISVIRALIHDPKTLLMDQPFGALDAITRKMLAYDFLELWKKTKKTIVMVTNDIDEALLLSTRILVMKANPGEIISELKVDIPIEERDEHVAKNPRHIELRKALKQVFDEIEMIEEGERNVN